MTVTATSPAMARSKSKTRSNSGAGHGSQRRLVEPLYFGADAARALIAKADSSVMSFPLSLLWIVMRDTPSRAATCVGVPMDTRSFLYSRDVMLSDDGCCLLVQRTLIKVLIGSVIRALNVKPDAVSRLIHGAKLHAGVNGLNSFLHPLEGSGGNGFCRGGDKCSGHVLVWLGVGRFQWQRGECKIFLRSRQELSVKSFYAPFLRLNS